MLRDKPRIRTDYHNKLIASTEVTTFHDDKLLKWFKIALVFMLGFGVGMIYSKTIGSFRSETLAYSEKENSISQQTAAASKA